MGDPSRTSILYVGSSVNLEERVACPEGNPQQSAEVMKTVFAEVKERRPRISNVPSFLCNRKIPTFQKTNYVMVCCM
jgi:hypothetical protein